MSQKATSQLSPLEDLFKRLCANKETQKALLEAIAVERDKSGQQASRCAVDALYNDARRMDAYAYVGVYNMWDDLHAKVSKF